MGVCDGPGVAMGILGVWVCDIEPGRGEDES